MWTHTDDRYSEDKAGMAPKKIPTLAGEFLEADEVVVDGRLVGASFWPIRRTWIRNVPRALVTRREP